MIEKKDATQVLSGRGWLSRLPSALRDEIVRSSALRTFARGDSIYREGDTPGGMYGVASGSVAVLVTHKSEGPYVAHLGQPGFWFGIGGAARELRRVSVEARRDTTVLYLPSTAVDKMVEASPSVWRHFTLNVVLNLDTAMRANNDLLHRDPYKRVAAILLRFAGDEPGFEQITWATEIDITQSELAQVTALSCVSVGRMLKRLQDAGLIDVWYGGRSG